MMKNRWVLWFSRLSCLLFAWPAGEIARGQEKIEPQVVWAAEMTEKENHFGSVLLAGDQIVAGDGKGALRGFNKKTGEILWTHEHGHRIYHRPASGDSKIYFTSEQGITAVSSKDGALYWTFTIPDGGGECAFSKKQNVVVCGGNDGSAYGVGAENGELVWRTSLLDDAPADPPGFDGAQARFGKIPARPTGIACDDDVAYLCIFDQCRVVALDLKTGKKKWSVQTGGWILPDPTLSSDSVYVASQDEHLWRIDKATGEVKWKFKTGNRIEGSCGLDEEFAYVGSCDGRFYCISIKEGAEKWRFETDKGPHGRPIYSKPHLAKSSVLFAAGPGKLYSVDKAAGTLRWMFDVLEKSETFCDAVADGERVYLVTRKSDGGGQDAIVAVTPAE